MESQLYRQKAETELKSILKFWISHSIDKENGGFYGEISNDLVVKKDAARSCVLCARILWTFSTAYRIYRTDEYLQMAQHAYDYLTNQFWDDEYRGVYWSVDAQGRPLNTRKQIYAQAFALYALSEFYRATEKPESLEKAIDLFAIMEQKSYDPVNKGYFEAYTREWVLEEDLRLSDKDLNAAKSMNTHLHVMEGYTNLFRVWKDATLQQKLEELINLTFDKIINPTTAHFHLFFSESWGLESNHISYGHDIEGSWLLTEALEVLGNDTLFEEKKPMILKMAQAVLAEGFDTDGGLFYEADPSGLIDDRKHWWPQAESVIGFYNAYQLSGKELYLDASLRSWDFIESAIIDHQNGEWFSRVSKDCIPDMEEPKVSAWKCPYHNSRACVEFMERLSK